MGCAAWRREGSKELIIVAFQYIKGLVRKTERLFTKGCSNRTKDNGFKLRDGTFRLGIKKKYFYKDGETGWWKGGPQVLNAMSLKIEGIEWK